MPPAFTSLSHDQDLLVALSKGSVPVLRAVAGTNGSPRGQDGWFGTGGLIEPANVVVALVCQPQSPDLFDRDLGVMDQPGQKLIPPAPLGGQGFGTDQVERQALPVEKLFLALS